MRIGFLGVGTMGAPMATRLVDAGYELDVFDTDPGRVAALTDRGATAVGSARAVGAAADVVFVSLPNARATEAAVLDPAAGVLGAMRPGATLVDLSTNSHALTLRVAAACAERGVLSVDAPVSSVSGPPEEGKLTVMVGGSADAVASVDTLLHLLGSNVVHLGGDGAGTAGKLITQCLGLTTMVAGMEALLVAARAGLDMAAVVDLIPVSNGQNFMFRVVRQLAEHRDFGEPGKVNGLVEIMDKDLGYAVELAGQLGVPHPTGAGAAGVFAEAMRRGYGPYHFSRVAQPLEEAAGAEIRLPQERNVP